MKGAETKGVQWDEKETGRKPRKRSGNPGRRYRQIIHGLYYRLEAARLSWGMLRRLDYSEKSRVLTSKFLLTRLSGLIRSKLEPRPPLTLPGDVRAIFDSRRHRIWKKSFRSARSALWGVEMYRLSKLRIRASLLLRSPSLKLLLDLQNEREEERGSTFKRPTLPRNEPLPALHARLQPGSMTFPTSNECQWNCSNQIRFIGFLSIPTVKMNVIPVQRHAAGTAQGRERSP